MLPASPMILAFPKVLPPKRSSLFLRTVWEGSMWTGRKFKRPSRRECPKFTGREGGGGSESRFAEEIAGKRSVTHKLSRQSLARRSGSFALRHPTQSSVFPDVSD